MRKNTSYRVRVVGILWEGTRATYEYSGFDHVPPAHEVIAKASDFMHVEDWQVDELTTTAESTKRGFKTTREVVNVKDWHTEAAEQFYMEANYA